MLWVSEHWYQRSTELQIPAGGWKWQCRQSNPNRLLVTHAPCTCGWNAWCCLWYNTASSSTDFVFGGATRNLLSLLSFLDEGPSFLFVKTLLFTVYRWGIWLLPSSFCKILPGYYFFSISSSHLTTSSDSGWYSDCVGPYSFISNLTCKLWAPVLNRHIYRAKSRNKIFQKSFWWSLCQLMNILLHLVKLLNGHMKITFLVWTKHLNIFTNAVPRREALSCSLSACPPASNAALRAVEPRRGGGGTPVGSKPP